MFPAWSATSIFHARPGVEGTWIVRIVVIMLRLLSRRKRPRNSPSSSCADLTDRSASWSSRASNASGRTNSDTSFSAACAINEAQISAFFSHTDVTANCPAATSIATSCQSRKIRQRRLFGVTLITHTNQIAGFCSVTTSFSSFYWRWYGKRGEMAVKYAI